MWPKLCLFALCLYPLSGQCEGKVVELIGQAYISPIKNNKSFLPLKKNQITPTKSLIRTADFTLLSLELSDSTQVKAGPNTTFYLIEDHEHFTLLLKDGNLKIKAIQRLKKQNTRKIVIKTSQGRIESSLGEFVVSQMDVMEHTSVYGLSGLVVFDAKRLFNKEQPMQIFANEESELTSLLERPASTSKISEKKRKDLEAFFQPKRKSPKN